METKEQNLTEAIGRALEATTITATPLTDGRYEYVVTYADGETASQKSKRRYEAAVVVWDTRSNDSGILGFSGSRQNAAKHPYRNWDVWAAYRVIDVKHV